MVASALVFIAAFFVLLRLSNDYLTPTPLFVATLGLVWFCLGDWQNALWGFQFAWYLVVLWLVALLYVMLVRKGALSVAVGIAVVASFTSFEGLLLWPVGLICLLWTRESKRRMAIWVAVGVGTVVVYSLGGKGVRPPLVSAQGFNGASQSLSDLTHHLGRSLVGWLTEIGAGIPLGGFNSVERSLIGALVLAAGLAASYRCLARHRVTDAFPVCLLAFGLMFTFFLAIGRARFGESDLLASRYTMPSLLMLSALVVVAWEVLPEGRGARVLATAVIVLTVLAGTLIATGAAFSEANSRIEVLTTAARIDATIQEVPPSQQLLCHTAALFAYGQPTLDGRLVKTMRLQQLSFFSSGTYVRLVREGVPDVSECVKT
jgi:hypothetical protein